MIHEVEVDTVKKDKLSVYHYDVFLSCFNLLPCCFRITVGSVMPMNLFIIIHLN